jgi:predicted transcriptional regulator
MEKPTQIGNRTRKEFDETCEQLLNVMFAQNIFELDKARYNALYREVCAVLDISKPTFNDHIKHLIKKGLVKRQKKGRQEVYLYLNINNLMIKNAKEMETRIKEETHSLMIALRQPQLRDSLFEGLALYNTLCNMRRWRIILEYLFTPNRAKENLLSLALQGKFQERLADYYIRKIVRAVEKLPSDEAKKEVVGFWTHSLDRDIEELREDFRELADGLKGSSENSGKE